MSNAFINSDLPENRLVLIDPPSILISLGYLPQGTVWVAKRAIYGLRESPALWAATRNKEMAKAHPRQWTTSASFEDSCCALAVVSCCR